MRRYGAPAIPRWHRHHRKTGPKYSVLLDFMRRELAVKVDYLTQSYQEGLLQRSRQRLQPPWGVDENEQVRDMVHASVLFPRSRRQNDYGGDTLPFAAERVRPVYTSIPYRQGPSTEADRYGIDSAPAFSGCASMAWSKSSVKQVKEKTINPAIR